MGSGVIFFIYTTAIKLTELVPHMLQRFCSPARPYSFKDYSSTFSLNTVLIFSEYKNT